MPRQRRRMFAGLAWVVASLVGWGVVCNVFVFVVFMYLRNERGMKLPSWSAEAYNWIAISGIVLIPVFVAVLAIRAYLPGTGIRPSSSCGFPVESLRTPGGT